MIGILDWGIGGLGFYRALQRARPETSVVYLSDSGHTPYGKLPAPQLAARVLYALGVLRSAGATEVVVACNAASTVLPTLGVRGLSGTVPTSHGPVIVTGVIAHALDMVHSAEPRALGIIGGERTIRSGAYTRALRARGIAVQQRVAQPLSALVERGELDSPVLHSTLRSIVLPLRNVTALLLACTHYAAIRGLFRDALPEAQLLDPVDALTPWVVANWSTVTEQRNRFFTTGDPDAMQRAAAAAFGVELAPERLCAHL